MFLLLIRHTLITEDKQKEPCRYLNVLTRLFYLVLDKILITSKLIQLTFYHVKGVYFYILFLCYNYSEVIQLYKTVTTGILWLGAIIASIRPFYDFYVFLVNNPLTFVGILLGLFFCFVVNYFIYMLTYVGIPALLFKGIAKLFNLTY